MFCLVETMKRKENCYKLNVPVSTGIEMGILIYFSSGKERQQQQNNIYLKKKDWLGACISSKSFGFVFFFYLSKKNKIFQNIVNSIENICKHIIWEKPCISDQRFVCFRTLTPARLQAESQKRPSTRKVHLALSLKTLPHLHLQHWTLSEPAADTSFIYLCCLMVSTQVRSNITCGFSHLPAQHFWFKQFFQRKLRFI